MGRLAGRAALVTGGSRGIGRAVVRALARAGAAVCVNYLRDGRAAGAVVEEAVSLGAPCALAVQADVRDTGQVAGLVASAAERLGRLDIVVHNAGVALEKLVLDTTAEDWDRLMAIHLDGARHCVRAALPHLQASGQGRVILVASVWGLVGAAGEAAYAAAKAALVGYARGLARELAPAGVTVNAIAPGAIDTDMLAGLGPAEREELVRQIPRGRLGRPEDVAAAAAFLASDGAAYITGQVLRVDGGWWL